MTFRRIAVPALAAALALGAPAAAQSAPSSVVPAPAPAAAEAPVRMQAISVLPLHFVLGFYAGDFERAVSPTTTVGVGASYFDIELFSYASTELKVRFYPSGDALSGLSFGVTAGPTFLRGDDGATDESVTAIGVGFELARSHLMGADRHFYYGYGGGLKRLYFTGEEADGAETVLPTLRLSVGYAF